MSDNFISEILRIWTDIKYEASIHFIEQLKALNLSMAKLSYTSWKPTHTPKIMVLNRKRRSSDERYDEFSIFLGLYRPFNIKTNFLTFQGVMSAIKALWKSNEVNQHNVTTNYETFTDTF